MKGRIMAFETVGKWIEKFGGWWLEPQPGPPDRARLMGCSLEFATLEDRGIGLDEPARIAKLIESYFDAATVSRIWLSDECRIILALVHSPEFPPKPDSEAVRYRNLDFSSAKARGLFVAPYDRAERLAKALAISNEVVAASHLPKEATMSFSIGGNVIHASATQPVVLRGNYSI